MKFQWQNAAIIIGLIGGCISIPKSAIEGWQAIFPRPKVEVTPGPMVTLAYEPGNHLLKCSVAILLSNAGNKEEIIRTLQAHLGIKNDPSKGVHFTAAEILLTGSQNEVPISVEPNTPATLTCEMQATLQEPLQSNDIYGVVATKDDDPPRELVLELTGQKGKSYQASFNFDFTLKTWNKVLTAVTPLTVSTRDPK